MKAGFNIGDRVRIKAATDPETGVEFPEIKGTIKTLDFCVEPDPEYLENFYPPNWFDGYPFVDCTEDDIELLGK